MMQANSSTQPAFSKAYHRVAIAILLLTLPLGGLIGYESRSIIYILGIVLVVSFIALCFVRPFWAFAILIFLGLTIWLSSIELVGGVTLMTGLGVIFTTAWIMRLLLRRARFIAVKEYWYALGMAITVGISTLLHWSALAKISPALTYLQLLLLVVLLVNFVNTPTHLYNIGHVFIVASAVMATLILLDKGGLLPEGVIKSVTSSTYMANNHTIYERVGGLFGDPNFTALQLTIALPFAFKSWTGSKFLTKTWLLLAGFAILIAFYFTFSIGGLVGIATMLFVKMLLTHQRNFPVVVLRLVLAGIINMWLITNFLPSHFAERIAGNAVGIVQFLQTHDQTLFLQLGTTRGDAWQAAFKTFMKSPLLGVGPGNAIFLNPTNSVLYPTRILLSPHNFLLSIANDLGLIGVAFFVGLLISAFLSTRKVPPGKSEGGGVRLSAFGDALCIALAACAVQGLGLDLQNQKVLWILLGMALAYNRIVEKSACN